MSALLEILSAGSAGSMALLAFAIRPAAGPMPFLAYAFLLGLGLHSLLLFSLSLVGLPLTRAVVMTMDLTLIILNGVLLVVLRSRRRAPHASQRSPWSLPTKKELVLITLILVLLAGHLIDTMYWPVLDGDAVGSYDFRAKAIAHEKTVAIRMFFPPWSSLSSSNFHYPFFVTMLQAHHYILGGANAKFYYSAILAAFLICFFHALRRRGCSPFHALGFTFLLLCHPAVNQISRDANLNFSQMVFITMAGLFLIRHLEEQEPYAMGQAALYLGLAGWVRADSQFVLGLFGLLVVLLSRRFVSGLRDLVILVAVYYAVTFPFEFFMRAVVHHNVAGDARLSVRALVDWTTLAPGSEMNKLWIVLQHFFRYSISPIMGYIGIPLLFFVLLDLPRWRQHRVMLGVIGVMLMGWIVLFQMISVGDWADIMRWSALRWYLNLVPLALFYIAQSETVKTAMQVVEGRVTLRLSL